jgi:hypothetical protein
MTNNGNSRELEAVPLIRDRFIYSPTTLFSEFREKIFYTIIYLLLLIPQTMTLVYFIIAQKKVEHIFAEVNQTNIGEYVVKIEKLVDLICETENVC